MILHRLKIEEKYLKRIRSGEKAFEIRKNDRDYQTNDLINFIQPDGTIFDGLYHNSPTYQITYIHHELGMADNYVVLSIKPIDFEFEITPFDEVVNLREV